MAGEQENVKVLRVSSVVPAIPTMKHHMFLSSIDLFYISFNNKRVMFYKIDEEEMDFSTITEKLKRSLSLVLVDFYPFAGRLDIKREESGRPEIDYNDRGVEFAEASIGMAFEELEKEEFRHKSFFKELVRNHDCDTSENGTYDEPLLSIQVSDFAEQVTAFLGGGICIGTHFHHVIVDGSSFWHFMKCWAECSRGLPISNKPEHIREIFKRDEKIYALPNVSWRAEEVVTDCIKEAQIFKFVREDSPPLNHSETNVNTDNATMENTNEGSAQIIKSMKDETDVELYTFRFSEEMVRKLKERAQASSAFVAVIAHFWRCLTKAREVPDNEPVDILVLSDQRGRIKPPLPPAYFGNCLSGGVARTSAKQLLGRDVCFAASLIQELINSCTMEMQLNNLIDWVYSNLSSVISEPIVKTLGAPRYYAGVAGSPKFSVYEIDHGWGKPLNVQPPYLNIGVISLIRGRDQNGERSIDVSTSLPRHQMDALKWILMIVPP
eukprot:PITA_10973